MNPNNEREKKKNILVRNNEKLYIYIYIHTHRAGVISIDFENEQNNLRRRDTVMELA